MIRRGFLVTVLLVSIAATSAPVTAQPTPGDGCISNVEGVETSYAELTGVVEQPRNQSDVVRITYTQIPQDASFEVELPSGVNVVRAEGFDRTGEASTVKYSGGETAVLEYRIGIQNANYQYANGSSWLFAPTPNHIGVGVNLELKPAGVVGREFLYIGNYTEYSTTVGCHEVSFVNAAAGSLPVSGERVIDSLRYAARTLDVGHRYEETTIFATPGFAHPPEAGVAIASDAWVSKNTDFYNLTSFRRVVLHEYVHTRQDYTQGAVAEMRWFTEGSAEYLSWKLAREVGAISPAQYNRWLKKANQVDGTLTNQSTWESKYVQYARGGVYLAVLEERLQQSNASVESLVRRINDLGGPGTPVLLQRHQFLGTVENLSSPAVRDWANSSMSSSGPYNLSGTRVSTDQGGVVDQLATGFEQRAAKKPYATVVVGLLAGVTLGMLPYEYREERGGEDRSDDGGDGAGGTEDSDESTS